MQGCVGAALWVQSSPSECLQSNNEQSHCPTHYSSVLKEQCEAGWTPNPA